jgi:hypothetical protein
MAFKAKFTVDGKEFNVLNCSYHFYQETDVTGRPSSIVRGGQMTITLESSDDNTMAKWMVDSWGLKSGNVKFFKRDSETAIMKQVDFSDAYLVSFDETYSHESSMPMIITATLTAKKLTVGDATPHENDWIK